MKKTRKDVILWDEETKRQAQELADHYERSLSAQIRYLVKKAWQEMQDPRQVLNILTDAIVRYDTDHPIARTEVVR